MGIIHNFIEYIFHLDRHLGLIIQNFGVWTYLLFFVIIFAETGFVVTPFLPGDSLLFAAGTFAASGALDIKALALILFVAAVAGDSANYAIGKFFGEMLLHKYTGRFIKKEYFDKTHNFYEKYGGKTIILARFVPIIRTFAPFVAGMGEMSYARFFIYNVTGGALWVALFVFGGFYFGNIPFVKQNFSLVIFVIIIISILPGVIEFWRHKRKNNRKTAEGSVK